MCWPATLRHRRREGHPKNGGNQGFSLMRMLRSRARLIHRRGPLGVDDFARVAAALAAFGLAIERAIRLAHPRRTDSRRAEHVFLANGIADTDAHSGLLPVPFVSAYCILFTTPLELARH